jgi:hypothetical protein
MVIKFLIKNAMNIWLAFIILSLAIMTGKEFPDTTIGTILHVGYWLAVLGTIAALASRTKLE